MSSDKDSKVREMPKPVPTFTPDELKLINEVFGQDGIVFSSKSHSALHGVMDKLEKYFKPNE